MILLEIDTQCISRIKLKGDAPWSVYVDRVTDRNEAFQGMKIEAREVHLFRRGRCVQPVKPDENAPVQFAVDFRRMAFRPQIGQRLAPERPDHVRL
jgi:hypothetical protein